MSAQSVIISFGERPRGLGEHRGGYDSSHSWQGPEDLDVAVLALRLVVIALDGREFVQQGVQACTAALALSVDQAQAWQQQTNMLSCGLEHTGCDPQRGGTQGGNDILRVQAANAVLAQQPLDGFRLQSAPGSWRRRQLKQGPQPRFVSRRTQLKRLDVEAVKLFAQAVGQPSGLVPKVLINPGELAQLNHKPIFPNESGESEPDRCTQRVTQHERIAARCDGRENDQAAWG
jgi:hypothetical protein